MPCCIVAYTIRQSRSLRRVPLFPLSTQEKDIGFGRLPQEINLYIYRNLYRRQGQLQQPAENLMGLKANQHRAKNC